MSRRAMRRSAWLHAIVALELIWTAAGAGVYVTRSMQPTAAEVIAYLRLHDMTHLPAADREVIMNEAVDRLGRLNFAQLNEVRISRALFAFYRPLSPKEKEKFAAMIIPVGLKRIAEAGRSVPAEQRRAFLESAFYHAQLDLVTAPPRIDAEAYERLVKDAVKEYLHTLTAEERLRAEAELSRLRRDAEPQPQPPSR